MKPLVKKCAAEFKRFCHRLPWNSRSRIIETAGEITVRQDILSVLKEKDFDEDIVKFLLEQDNTMDFLYDRYLNRNDLCTLDGIEEMIECVLE